MPIDAEKVESPGWWLQRLGKQLLDERDDQTDADGETEPGLDTLKKYAEGKAPLPHVPGIDPREIAEWMKDARTNWTSLVLDSPVERLGVDGFRFGGSEDDQDSVKADEDAHRIWRENGMKADSALVHYGALSQRRAFVLVEKGDDGRPVLTHETPRQVVVEDEQGSRRKIAAGLKLWHGDTSGAEPSASGTALVQLDAVGAEAVREHGRDAAPRVPVSAHERPGGRLACGAEAVIRAEHDPRVVVAGSYGHGIRVWGEVDVRPRVGCGSEGDRRSDLEARGTSAGRVRLRSVGCVWVPRRRVAVDPGGLAGDGSAAPAVLDVRTNLSGGLSLSRGDGDDRGGRGERGDDSHRAPGTLSLLTHGGPL